MEPHITAPPTTGAPAQQQPPPQSADEPSSLESQATAPAQRLKHLWSFINPPTPPPPQPLKSGWGFLTSARPLDELLLTFNLTQSLVTPLFWKPWEARPKAADEETATEAPGSEMAPAQEDVAAVPKGSDVKDGAGANSTAAAAAAAATTTTQWVVVESEAPHVDTGDAVRTKG